MTIQADIAVVKDKEAEFEIQQIEIDDPGPQEVRIKVVATGLCHTDLSVRDGNLPTNYPVVLGHEGAGIIEKVGELVSEFEEGDRVVLSYGSCGSCRPCQEGDPAYCNEFNPLNFLNERQGSDRDIYNGDIHGAFFQQSSFGTYAIAHQRNVVKIENEDIDIALLGPLGCGIQTGAGAVINTLNPTAGTSIAVSGVGSVGLSAVMAARIAGCHPIIAIDLSDERLELAKELGATHTVNAKNDVVEAIQKIVPHGVDNAVECAGHPDSAQASFDALSNRGTLAIVGAPPAGTDYAFDANDHILSGRKVIGCVEGDSRVKQFIPTLVALYVAGDFPFDKLTSRYDFKDINKAVHDMEDGKAIKPILVMPQAG